jgi:hypothetical protein
VKRLEKEKGGFPFEADAQGTHEGMIVGRGNLNLCIFASTNRRGHQHEGGKVGKFGAEIILQ